MEFPVTITSKSLFFTIPFFLLITVGCDSGNSQSVEPARVSGTIQLDPCWKREIYLVRPSFYSKILADYEMKVIQTVPLNQNGHFEFRVNPQSENTLYFLLSQEEHQKFNNHLAAFPWQDNYIGLHLYPGNEIELESNIQTLSFSTSFIKTDEVTKNLLTLHHLRKPIAEAIQQQYKKTADPSSFSFNIHGNTALEERYHAALDNFLDTCTQAIPLFTGLRMRETDNEFMDNPEFFINLKTKIADMAPDHPWLNQYGQFLQKENLPLLKGEKLPHFTLPSYQGDSLRLNDLRGKLILVDFWASWCAPCRKETRNTLVPLYKKYQDKGFEIAGISIDADENVWRKAIEKDQAFWLHGCDFQGDASPIRQSLRFEYIPSSYLLDENGVLLERNLHGNELIRYVENYFSKK